MTEKKSSIAKASTPAFELASDPAVIALAAAKDLEAARLRELLAKAENALKLEREKSAQADAARKGASTTLEAKTKELEREIKHSGEIEANSAATAQALIAQLGKSAELATIQSKQISTLLDKTTAMAVLAIEIEDFLI